MAGKPYSVSFFTHCKLDIATGCWNWQGGHCPAGYGRIRYMGRSEYVHRVSAHLYLGLDLASPLHVCHKCDNPNCFNPKHLFIGTALDNSLDKIRKGRWKGPTPWGHCKQGHPMKVMPNAKPLYGSHPRRYCPTCSNERTMARYYKLKESDRARNQ